MKVPQKIKIFGFVFWGLLLLSCNQSTDSGNNEINATSQKSPELEPGFVDTLQNIDSVNHNGVSEVTDPFEIKISEARDSLLNWGFNNPEEKIITQRDELKKHWWLKIFDRYRDRSPSEKDWNAIKQVRQLWFKKTWKFVIEEWTFDSEKSAQKWLNTALNTERLDDHKPPREYWTENNKLYFVMATAAKDWFEHGRQLTEIIAGKKIALFSFMNRPIKLKEYKKSQGQSNSGIWGHKPYFYRPDTVGTYYRYFLFQKFFRKHGNKSVNGLVIGTYVYGKTIGDYNKVEEELMSIKAKYNEPKLHFDLVGYTKDQVVELFGKGENRDTQNLVYFHDHSILILHFEQEKVAWFRYLRIKDPINVVKDVPNELFEYEGM